MFESFGAYIMLGSKFEYAQQFVIFQRFRFSVIQCWNLFMT